MCSGIYTVLRPDERPGFFEICRSSRSRRNGSSTDPKILSPKEFLDECLYERFPNPYLGDTVQRLVTDISQGVGVRFGETVKAYVERDGDAKKLRAIPLAIAGWLRYRLAVDDEGNTFELSPDPMNDELQEQLAGVVIGDPSSLGDRARKNSF